MGLTPVRSNARLKPVAVSLNTNHTSVKLLGGFSIKESDGTPAVASVNIRKGVLAADNSGTLLFALEFAANESLVVILPVPIEGDPTYGIYVEDLAGTTSGVLLRWSE